MRSKNERERPLLDEFISLYPDFPVGQIRASDPPDFLVESGSQIIGIELVDYVRGQDREGSPQRQNEELHRKILARAQGEFESRHGIPLLIHFYWSDRRPLTKKDVEAVSAYITRIVESRVPQQIYSTVELKCKELSHGPLEGILRGALIVRLEEQGRWLSGDADWIGVGTEELAKLIASKEAKIDGYLQKCSSVWLIIMADGKYMSSTALLDEATKRYPFSTRFDRVLFWDRAYGNITLLNKNGDIPR